MKKRILELDSIRGIAAIAVVFYHYFYRYNDIYGHQSLKVEWIVLGKHGVELFFMVSGFVIFWSLNRINKPMDFIVLRFSRLYPVYWAAVILTFILVYIFGLEGRSVSVNDAIINLTMLQGFINIPHVDGVYWTLVIELIFYFWMFILFLCKQHNKAELILFPLVVISALQSIGMIDMNNVINKILLIDYISFFISGICFYKLLNDKNKKITICILLFCLISTALTYSLLSLLLFAFLYLFFYLGISERIKGLNNKYLIYLGSISYALYLIHKNIGYIIINKFYDMGFSGFVGIFFSIVISIVIAHFLTSIIEKPSLNIIRKLYARLTLKFSYN